jgi:acetyl esterase/lipase
LWCGALGLLGTALGFAALIVGSHRATVGLALVLGIAAMILGMLPPLQACGIARANDVELSLQRYLFGASEAHGKVEAQTITYATVDGQKLELDAYLPAGAGEGTTRRAAIIVVHGGSWNGGERSDFPQWDEWLNEQGYAVFDVEYRLAPQPNWRTATGDIKCAVGWVKRNASQYGVDPQRIALMGRSAGGHLALLAAYASNDERLPPSCDANDTSVRAVIAFYAPTDLRWAYGHPANQRVIDGPATLRSFLGGDPQTASEAFDIASPIAQVRTQTTPTLMFHGGRDQLVREENMYRLAEKLDVAHVPHKEIFIPYAQHGFDYNFDGWGSQIAQPVMLRFLQTYVAPK